MAIEIRRAEPADAGALHAVAARTFGLACPPGTAPADIDAFIAAHLSQERFTAYLADAERIVLLAEEDDLAVGYAMLVATPTADPDVLAVVDAATSIELSKFYVLAGNHGSPVAPALMAGTLDAAAGTGATSCWLGVNQQNARAARFYEKHGFEVGGTKRFLVGAEWHDDHIRIRHLA